MTDPRWLVAAALVVACGPDPDRREPAPAPASGKQDATGCEPGLYTVDLPGWPGRPYDVYVPDGVGCAAPAPVVIAVHGGGGNSEHMAEVTCPFGDFSDPDCLDAVAERERFLAVYPNGTSGPVLPDVRTFNAGGGAGGYDCIAGRACDEEIDDVAYFHDVIDDLQARFEVDASRVYATGLSNGGAMSHRLACEMSDRIAAIADVAGTHQVAAVQGCEPSRPVPVMVIHGTLDRVVPYHGGVGELTLGWKVSTAASVQFWVDANGCSTTPTTTWLPNTRIDGTRVVRDVYGGCDDGASVVLLEIRGGGHNWPGGGSVGPYADTTTRDITGSKVIWSFFDAHAL